MAHSSVRVLTILLLSCFSFFTFAQDCCPDKEKVGKTDQFLYDLDNIQLDTYTDQDNYWLEYTGDKTEPRSWNYNKFIRIRAWSNRPENTDDYIQLYWWIGDGKNSNLTQSYANGLGPKAGTYILENPMMGASVYQSNYYWTYTTIPTNWPILLAYRISYGTNSSFTQTENNLHT